MSGAPERSRDRAGRDVGARPDRRAPSTVLAAGEVEELIALDHTAALEWRPHNGWTIELRPFQSFDAWFVAVTAIPPGPNGAPPHELGARGPAKTVEAAIEQGEMFGKAWIDEHGTGSAAG